MMIACLLSLLVCHVAATTITLDSIKMCENKTYKIQLTAQDRMRNGLQEYDWAFKVGETLGNDNNMRVVISRDYGQRTKNLMTVQRKGFCNGLREYGGALITDVLTLMDHPHPSQCPIEKGTYHMSWHYIDFAKIPFAKFVPGGKFQLKLFLTDLSNKDIACFVIAVEKK